MHQNMIKIWYNNKSNKWIWLLKISLLEKKGKKHKNVNSIK